MDTWSDRVADAVCSVLRENTSLHSMDLFRYDDRGESIHELCQERIGAVLQALQTNQAIVYVRILAGSYFGHGNWNRLADLLLVNDSIESIYIAAGNDSIPDRVVELLQQIKSNKTLQSLGARYADFHREHMNSLVDVLSDNYVLASLVDHGMHPDKDGRDGRLAISCVGTKNRGLC